MNPFFLHLVSSDGGQWCTIWGPFLSPGNLDTLTQLRAQSKCFDNEENPQTHWLLMMFPVQMHLFWFIIRLLYFSYT